MSLDALWAMWRMVIAEFGLAVVDKGDTLYFRWFIPEDDPWTQPDARPVVDAMSLVAVAAERESERGVVPLPVTKEAM